MQTIKGFRNDQQILVVCDGDAFVTTVGDALKASGGQRQAGVVNTLKAFGILRLTGNPSVRTMKGLVRRHEYRDLTGKKKAFEVRIDLL